MSPALLLFLFVYLRSFHSPVFLFTLAASISLQTVVIIDMAGVRERIVLLNRFFLVNRSNHYTKSNWIVRNSLRLASVLIHKLLKLLTFRHAWQSPTNRN